MGLGYQAQDRSFLDNRGAIIQFVVDPVSYTHLDVYKRQVLQECLTQKQEEGTLRTYNLRYLRQDNGLFQKIAFVDTSMQQATLQEMMSSHIQIAVAAFFLLLAISIAQMCIRDSRAGS